MTPKGGIMLPDGAFWALRRAVLGHARPSTLKDT